MIPLTPDDDARDQERRETQDLPFTPAPRPVSPATALAPPPARVDPLNLARRPFLNSRPVVRASLFLWLLGLALLLGNVSLFWNYRQRSADKREQITRGEAEIASQEAAAAKLRHQLDSFDLDEQNQRVDFLNRQIAERTFSWSDLLDRITERLPHDVRLNKLAPVTGGKAGKETQERARATRRAARTGDQVSIEITGESRNDDQLLAFVQSLFRAPFADPDFSREERQEDGTTKFEISVLYRPGTFSAADAAAARAAADSANAGTTAGAAAGTSTGAARSAGAAMTPAPPRAAVRGTSGALGGTLGTPTAPTGSPRGTSAPGSATPRVEELPMPAAGARPTAPRPVPRPTLRPAPTQPPPTGGRP